ncbi:MAG: CsgG/HfaB family protein [Balneolales bacterium]
MSGCASYMQPFERSPAKVGNESHAKEGLSSLPEPSEKIVAAIYRFRDQSGQYKSGANFSTAVTQGSTSILMRSLEESGWFTTIEREGLSNLLNERQIIQSIRSQHADQNGNKLPPISPLLYAGILLEGGIVSYDTNVITGGLGVRYFGAGGSGEFRQDQVTVYLRAISTQSGRVLKTVYTTKTIISQKVDGSLFRFITPTRMMETEAGYSFNEPTTIAVTEAIEMAVKSLIIEGVDEGLWNLKNQEDYYSDTLENYRNHKDDDLGIDFGRAEIVRPTGLAIGFNAGAQLYEGNYGNSMLRPTGELMLRYQLSPKWGIGLQASRGNIASEGRFEKSMNTGELRGTYHLISRQRISPFLLLGGGVLVENQEIFDFIPEYHPYATGGIGLELLLSKRLGATIILKNNYSILDGLDGLNNGYLNDNIWSAKMGFTWYLGKN